MSGRGSKGRGRPRGRPPKASNSQDKKFNYNLLKKPKYLQKNDSRFSTPSASRASSPQDSEESSRKGISRRSTVAKTRGRRPTKNSRGGHSSAKKGYSSPVYNKTDYHYGSDFGDSTDKSEDEMQISNHSDSDSAVLDDSDSEFSLSSYSNVSTSNRNGNAICQTRGTTPDLVWLKEDIELPAFDLPDSSEDLLVPKEYILKTVGVYEILRRYRNLVRLSPFRIEDFCAALMCTDQSPLLVEIHITLLKAILREEDSQQTHFGPLDQKDSVNIGLYLIDQLTWPEVLRSYVESDQSLDTNVLSILSDKEYPYTEIEDRLAVLQLLTDQFLTTTSVRDDMIQEGPIHYDDHCRICHRLGDLLCCETCPAVFHLECVDPPLTDVPTEDWQCNICKSHSVSGVVDCVSLQEKQGMLCRQEHYGFDRHGRKYWFVCRRLFVETEDGTNLWYYTTLKQLNYVMSLMDSEDYEYELHKTINDNLDLIQRQMELTEKLTNQLRGNKKSYLEKENQKLAKLIGTVSRKSSTNDEKSDETDNEQNGTVKENEDAEPKVILNDNTPEVDEMDIEENLNATEINKSKNGTQISSLPASDENDASHLTRSKLSQITNGTLYFKLGMEHSFKTYVNQFAVNHNALNKPQKNEERDKKRHLSHKFSLTHASEFKWSGTINGTQNNIVTVLKQTLITFEQQIAPSYMHCNWQKLRKNWLNALTSCSTPDDFAKTLIALQSCFKGVIFANVWHDQLGHTKLYRITAQDREDKKKIEKREKRERDDEEERHRLAYNFVKYSLGLKHQVWKQKGEEYRIHGQWGWLWALKGRRVNHCNKSANHQKIRCINVMVKHESKEKVISLHQQTYKHLPELLKLDTAEYPTLSNVEVMNQSEFASIDVSTALSAPIRVLFPKIARKSCVDDLLAKRERLRDLELKQAEPKEEINEIDIVDPKPVFATIKEKFSFNTHCVSKILVDLMENKVKQNKPKLAESEFTETCRRIYLLRKQLLALEQQLMKNKCFSRHCRDSMKSVNLQSFAPCFSILCLKAVEARREINTLIQDLKDEHNLNEDVISPSILEQRLTEQKNNDFYEILKKFELCDFVSEHYWQNDLSSCLDDLTTALANGVDFDSTMVTSAVIKKEDKMEVEDNKIKNQVLKKEQTETAVSGYVNHPNRRFCNTPKPTKKEIEISKEFDKDGKEKMYSTTSTGGKIYLHNVKLLVKSEIIPHVQPNGCQDPVPLSEGFKYPIITNFSTYKLSKNIMVLPKYEVSRLARRAGKTAVNGFNHQAKNNNSVWPYPCSRPLFKTCWTYRTFCLNSLSTFALQLRIIWTCMRWDDMATKPATADGKNQVTTETEIMSLELLKHRQVGMFMERTQYLRRKIVIPLELPKTVREVQSIRSGLRKRKRAESPQQTEPQVAEEWVDEDKLELWEIKQYGEKQDKVVLLPTTRTSTGKLPPQRLMDDGITRNLIVSSKSTPEQIKEKIEAQLKIQRDAHNKKRAEDMKGQQNAGVKTIRKILVKNPDGTTKIINQIVSSPAPTPITPKQPEQQKVQIIRGSDGKVSVRGLQPWQQLIQTPDGKLHVIASPQSTQPGQPKIQQRVVSKPAGQLIGAASCSSPSTHKTTPVVIRQSQIVKSSFNNNNSNNTEQRILNAETVSESQAANQPQMQRVITSSGQIITQQVQSTNTITTSNLQQLLQRGTIQGQKIIVNPSPVQKLLVTSPTAQNTGEKRFIIQQNAVQQPQQQIIVNQQGQIIQQQPLSQQIMIGNQKVLLSPMQTTQTQQIKSPVQQIQMQIQSPEKQVVQQQQTQVVMQNNTNLAQQIATGKVQLATINGQQVLIRQIGNNQAQIIGHVKTQEQPKVETVVKQQTQQIITKMVQIQPQQQQQSTQQTNVVAVGNLDNAAAIEQSLLQGQPPGTVIKCVTAQVVQTNNGPRIVLQGLQGNDFTPAQTALVQQQVKQQLLKAQESNGKQGVLGPTKIYLAIQPAQQSQPPPLTPVMHQQLDDVEMSYAEEDADGNFVLTPAYITNTIKTVLKQGGLNPEIEEKLLNLQRYQEKQMRGEPIDASSFPPSLYSTRDVSPIEENFDDESMTSTKTSRKPRGQLAEDDDEEWVIDAPKRRPIKMPASAEKVTRRADRDYMAEFKNTIFNDKQEENSNQGLVIKSELVKTEPVPSKSSNIIVSFLKRNDGLKNNANLTPVSTGINQNFQVIKTEKSVIQPKREIRNKAKENQTFGDSPAKQSKLNLQLHKHKEILKKLILKKRNLLEKELQCEIQKELSMEMASHIKNVHAKHELKKDLVSKQAVKRKLENQCFSGGPLGSGIEHTEEKFEKPRSSKKVAKTNLNDSSEGKNKKKQKIYCICRKPYDRTKFYIGCDVCNNWFHGECVGVTEDQSKSMTEFVCDECQRAKNTQELFCLCRTPYDQALFYICCDKCQDWFHGKCVGILQSEADFIDEYICPNCQKNSSINYANMKPLHDTEFEDLRVFLKDIQNHKSAWPFMDAVDANEVPDYYNVIKDPMDLKQIEMKVMCQSYNCLADFIKDMTKVFDNCRYYNSKDSSFCKCAEGLENYFIQKLNGFRDTLVKNESLAK